MNLFRFGECQLHSGQISNWKIDCDALSSEDWDTLAHMAMEFLPPFCGAVGVPRGGNKFADALLKHRTSSDPSLPFLIVDDVLTTGSSMEEFRDRLMVGSVDAPAPIGVVAFARGLWPDWVTPVCVTGEALRLLQRLDKLEELEERIREKGERR
jgi:hypothetical protein